MFLDKVNVIKGRSQIELKILPINSFDIIYIDGSHVAKDVLIDAVYSWQPLKLGGIMIFDDYKYGPKLAVESKPQIAIDSFMAVFSGHIEVIFRGYQVILKKVKKQLSP
jgi:predicted O-methyltransferase YrrM